MALPYYLNHQGEYDVLYANVEVGQASRDDYKSALPSIMSQIAGAADSTLKDKLPMIIKKTYARKKFYRYVVRILLHWCQLLDKPLVLFLDEIDALVGDTLVFVLRQLPSGYASRPQAFPSLVILCGVRDVRDYRIQTSGKDITTCGSAFNIKA